MIKKILVLIFLLNSISYAGGWNWQNPKPQGNTINKIAFYDQWYGYMVGESGTILFSSDYGLTWEEQNEGMPDNLYDISVVDSITAWVVGDNGTIQTRGLMVSFSMIIRPAGLAEITELF